MTVYYAIIVTFGRTGAYRMIENSRGEAHIRLVQQIVVGGPPPASMPPIKK